MQIKGAIIRLISFIYFLSWRIECGIIPSSFRARASQFIKKNIQLVGSAGFFAFQLPRLQIELKQKINFDDLKSTVNSGRVFVCDDFLSPSMLKALQDDISFAEEKGIFMTSGLSNRASQTQNFDAKKDRSVAPVLGMAYTSLPLKSIEPQIIALRHTLASELSRESLADNALPHEMYYSLSPSGCLLPRHMDERHEELKGRKGWLGSSRRSLSWLLYLSDYAWDYRSDGGQLRAFPIAAESAGKTLRNAHVGGSHLGNLQIAWLQGAAHVRPVYMCMVGDTTSRLYVLGEEGQQEWITRPFDIRDSTTGRRNDSIFTASLFPTYSQCRLDLLEEVNQWARGEMPAGSEILDVNPKGGRLVIFDSVMLPHEVVAVADGGKRRMAIAGWMHERVDAHTEYNEMQTI